VPAQPAAFAPFPATAPHGHVQIQGTGLIARGAPSAQILFPLFPCFSMIHHTSSHPSAAALQADASPSTRHRWMPTVSSEGLRYRLAVAVRAVAAIAGGYALAALSAAALSVTLPLSRSEASLTGTLASFVVHACAVMWVFAARTALWAWLGLLVAAAPFGLMLVIYFYGGSAA
jgi:hypothetical protein